MTVAVNTLVPYQLIEKLSVRLTGLLGFDVKLKENLKGYKKGNKCFNLETEVIDDPEEFGILNWMVDALCVVIRLCPYPDDENWFRGYLGYHYKPVIGKVKIYNLPSLITWNKNQPNTIHLQYNRGFDDKNPLCGETVNIE